MQIIIFGGSFNPPHIGHVEAAQVGLKQIRADKMIVIPAAKAPQKEQEADCPDASSRLIMTELSFMELPLTEVSNIEILRGGVSYTIDTLRYLKECYPDDRLYLLMGADQFLSFESWKDFRTITEICTLMPFLRGGCDFQDLYDAASRLKSLCDAEVQIIKFVPTEISSTELRQLLPQRKGSEYFVDSVYSEIIRHRWYSASPELSWLRGKAYAYLDPNRVSHVRGCEHEAVKLAERWGADVGLAAEAAILHDISKSLKSDKQLNLCSQHGIMTDVDEKANYKLLHSKTGAALSRELFGICDEVYSAIFWHTTAKEDMSLLEKIIYLADYIEPGRKFEGVEELRYLAYKDLEKALVLGLKLGNEELLREGINVHPNSQKALNWLLENQKTQDERKPG